MKEAIVMKQVGSKSNHRYSDIQNWEGRWELIHGVPFNMTPAPSRIHQEISGELFYQLRNFFKEDGCRVYSAPTDVFLSETDEYDNSDTVVQPDILVVCDEKKLMDKGVKGAPDFVVEIVSPSTAIKDRNQKRPLYQKHGVKELWIIDPAHPFVEQYDFVAGTERVLSQDDEIESTLFKGFTIKVNSLIK